VTSATRTATLAAASTPPAASSAPLRRRRDRVGRLVSAGGPSEGRILAKYGRFELTKLGRGLEPETVDEEISAPAVDVQRLGLAAAR
jgi:hypothetical protein